MSDRHGVRILIADDDPAIVRLMSTALTRKGFPPPLEVSTGQAAVSSAGQADILLLDYQLPDLSGMEVLEQLQHHPNPPSVVLVTAHGGEQVAAGALRLGAEDYLTKDGSLVELLPEVVERVRRTRALQVALAEAERELMLAARREAIVEMTVTLHHEINNPLMTAFAELSILLDDEHLSPHHRPGVEETKAALERVRDIMRRAGDLQSAQAVEYVDGITMTDLSALPEPAPANGLPRPSHRASSAPRGLHSGTRRVPRTFQAAWGNRGCRCRGGGRRRNGRRAPLGTVPSSRGAGVSGGGPHARRWCVGARRRCRCCLLPSL